MPDLLHVLELAFSGSDLTRALWLAPLASLFCRPSFEPIAMAVPLFLLDRLWPYVGMAFYGYDLPTITAAFTWQVTTLPEDSLMLAARFAGLFTLVGLGYALRRGLHRLVPEGPALPSAFA